MEQQHLTNALASVLSSISISPTASPMTSPLLSSASTTSVSPIAHPHHYGKSGSSLLHRLPGHSSSERLIKRRLSNPEYFPADMSPSSLDSNPRLLSLSPKLEILRNKRFRNFRRLSSEKLKYDPYDKAALDDRINSFGILQWTVDDYDEAYDYNSDTESCTESLQDSMDEDRHYQENRLTPLQCARYGWKCNPKKKNELICQTCHSILLVRLNNRQESDSLFKSESGILFQFDEDEMKLNFMSVRKKLLNGFLKKLVTGHYSYCSWKQFSTPLSTYLVSFSDMELYLQSFQSNLNALIVNKHYLRMKPFRRVLSDEQLKILENYTRPKYQDVSFVILTLALLGWKIKMQKFGAKNLILVNCTKCTRRILLGEEKEKTRGSGNDNLLAENTGIEIEKLPDSEYPAAALHHGVKDVFTTLNNESGSTHTNPNYNKSVHYYHDESDSEFEVDALEEDDEIDLISEHRNWCCYVSHSNDDSKVPGYELILKMMRANTPQEHSNDLHLDTFMNSENDVTLSDIIAFDSANASTKQGDVNMDMDSTDSAAAISKSLQDLRRLRTYL